MFNANSPHIFAPAIQPQENWVERILGTVVKPLYTKFEKNINWMWVTRYIEPLEAALRVIPPDFLSNYPIPVEYRIKTQDMSSELVRYIVLRLDFDEDIRHDVHESGLLLAKENGYYVVPWQEYDVVNDLGSDRFLPTTANYETRARRANQIARFIDATLKLMLDMLVEENGGWKLETSDHMQSQPNETILVSVHHLFCNLTQFTPNVVLSRLHPDDSNSNPISLGTLFMHGYDRAHKIDIEKLALGQGYRIELQY